MFAQRKAAPDVRRTAHVSKRGATMCQRGAPANPFAFSTTYASPRFEFTGAAGWAMLRHQLNARARRTRAESGP